MAKKNTRIIYRDSITKRFVSKSTWKRSKSHGGDRYKRETIPIRKEKEITPPPPPPPEGDVFEFVVSFSYDKSGRSFDLIVTAVDRKQAEAVAKEFLSSDLKGKNISRAGYQGWKTRIAKGNASEEEAGEAEYREDSEEE